MDAVPAAVAALLGLPVLLLAVPVGVAFRVQGPKEFVGQLTVSWLFGLVRFGIPVPWSAGRRSPAASERTRSGRSRPKRRARGAGGRFMAVMSDRAFRSRALRLVSDLARAARFEQLALRLRLGLGDPADTGRLWALLGPLGAAVGNLRDAQVRLEPDFAEPALEFQAQGRCRLLPLQVVALIVAFALSPSALRAWRTLGARDA